jgi:hypothetical protein
MTLILTLISSLLPIVLSEIQKLSGLSPSLVTLIEGLTSAGTTLASTLASQPATAPSILAAFAATITVLQTELAGNQGATTALIYLGAFDAAVQAGLAASKITVVDPAALEPVTPA